MLWCTFLAAGGWVSACSDEPVTTGQFIAVSLTPPQSIVAIGDTVRLRAEVSGRPAPARVLWSTSVPAIASVDSAGLVRGLAVGQAIVTASDAREQSAKASALVNVRAP
jgi:lactocepin